MVLAFGIFGFAFDGIMLFAFRFWGGEEAEAPEEGGANPLRIEDDEEPLTPTRRRAEEEAPLTPTTSEDASDGEEPASPGGRSEAESADPALAAAARSADAMNMCSAFVAVLTVSWTSLFPRRASRHDSL